MAKCKQIHFYETNENHNFFPQNFTTHGILFLLHTHTPHEFDKWWAHHTVNRAGKNGSTAVENTSVDTSWILEFRSLCMHIVHVIAIIGDSSGLYNRLNCAVRMLCHPEATEEGVLEWKVMPNYFVSFFVLFFIMQILATLTLCKTQRKRMHRCCT